MTTLSDVNQEISFAVTLPATPRGAHLARRLAVAQLTAQSVPFEDAAQIVAELAGNAVTHGRVPGRGFRLSLDLWPGRTLRIEVADTRSEAEPPVAVQPPEPEAESGRGLLLVSALAARWGTEHGLPPLKKVWAEIDLSGGISPDRGSRDPAGRAAVPLDT
ncbi:ATP-binding protein [Streptomyces sp. NPDC089799]|uniref:ATP-binding protein n=1 Tax=Streptomyces sp. NPDC089799 TaxID=3155066 RepID=UPI0034163456